MSYFDIYTNANEYSTVISDSFDRVPPQLSNNKDTFDPVISRRLHEEGFVPKYKDGKKYAVCFSHDIDFLYDPKNANAYFVSSLLSLKSGNFKKTFKNLKSMFKPTQNDDWSLDKLIDIERKNNIRSTYYFLSLTKGEQDFNYELDEVKKYFPILEEMGCEVGLHGAHQAFNNGDKLAQEKTLLESKFGANVEGYRNHYLRFKVPYTWEVLKEQGFIYDTTYGYAQVPGYRNGMCYPFRPFNRNTNEFIDIIEIPLIVMDVTFFKYMNLTVAAATELFKRIYSDVKKLNGVLTILWHNNCLQGDTGELYEQVLKIIREDEEAWVTTSLELANWWRENNLNNMETVLQKIFDKK